MADGNFAISIIFKIDDEEKAIILDNVSEGRVNSSVNVTTHPVLNGDIIADHEYRNPKAYSFSGEFSTKSPEAILITKDGEKLANIQSTFERLQNEAILCDIVKCQIKGSDSEPRFSIRNNMLLQRINWTEKINTLGFSFDFTEIMLAEVNEYEKIEEDDLPDVTEPEISSFSELLVDFTTIPQITYNIMLEEEIVANDFDSYVKGLNSTELQAAIGSASIAAVVVAAVSKVAFSLASAGVITGAAAVGTAVSATGIGAIAVGVALAGVAIWYAVKNKKKSSKWKIKQFKKHLSENKNKQELERLGEVLNDINVKMTEMNNYILLYGIKESIAQQVHITVGEDHCYFTFTKNNTTNGWDFKILDVFDREISNLGALEERALTDMSQCSSSNTLSDELKEKGYNTYIFFLGTDEEKSDLTKYYIMITEVDMDKFGEFLADMITSYLLY